MEEIDSKIVLKALQIKWKTSISMRADEFSEIINDDEVFEKYFGVKYVEKLTDKSKDLMKTIIKLGLIYTILMISLFTSQNISESEFEIFGYGFKNLGSYKEFLLFLTAIISPISAILTAYRAYILALIEECLKKLSPDINVRKFYSCTFLDNYFDGFPKRQSGIITWRAFTTFLMIIFGLTISFLFIALVIGSFFVQINVIYDVSTNPISTYYVNTFVIIFTITSILFSWVVSIMQLPMPVSDAGLYLKLSEIESKNPKIYQELLSELSAENRKKNKLHIILISGIIYILTFSFISIYWFSGSLDNISYFLNKSMVGAFLVMFTSYGTVQYLHKKSYQKFFNKYKNKTDDRFSKFKEMEKKLLFINIFIPFFMSILYILLTIK